MEVRQQPLCPAEGADRHAIGDKVLSPEDAAVSRRTVALGCSCRKDAGTWLLTGPSTDRAAMSALFSPNAMSKTRRACTKAKHVSWQEALQCSAMLRASADDASRKG